MAISTPGPQSNLSMFLAQVSDQLGTEVVTPAEECRNRYGSTTYSGDETGILGMVHPRSTEEVQRVMRSAHACGVPIYPISRGRNWGYGSAAPPGDAVVLNLGRMSQILEYDARLGYLRVQPGVTFEQAARFLAAEGDRHWLDAPGTTPDASLVGNALERGFGHTPYADHAAHAAHLEVVLPDGTLIDTGLGAFGPAKARHVFPGGLGPRVDGLFFQSGFGIVTAMTLWLMPKPEHFEAYFFGIQGRQRFAAVLEAMQPLRQRGIVPSAVHIGNSYRVLPSLTSFPWDALPDGGPLAGAALDSLRGRFGIVDWHGSGAFYGSLHHVRECRRRLRTAIRGGTKSLSFIQEWQLPLIESIAGVLKRFGQDRLSRQVRVLRPAFELLQGKPGDSFLRMAYWRKRTLMPADPDLDRDRCGLIWCSVLSTFRAPEALEVNDIACREILKGGYEPGITTTLLTGRCLEHVISIVYDRDLPGEDARAIGVYETVLRELIKAGYYPYRLPTFAQNLAERFDGAGAHTRFVKMLKDAIDSKGVLSPGRYSVG